MLENNRIAVKLGSKLAVIKANKGYHLYSGVDDLFWNLTENIYNIIGHAW